MIQNITSSWSQYNWKVRWGVITNFQCQLGRFSI